MVVSNSEGPLKTAHCRPLVGTVVGTNVCSDGRNCRFGTGLRPVSQRSRTTPPLGDSTCPTSSRLTLRRMRSPGPFVLSRPIYPSADRIAEPTRPPMTLIGGRHSPGS